MTVLDGGTDAGGGSEADAAAPTTSVPPAPLKAPDLGMPSFRYPGTGTDFVVIVAGIHTSEQSGVEVARWINAILAAGPKPTRLGAVIIPEVFPQYGLQARAKELLIGARRWDKSNDYRDYPDPKTGARRYPNRHFPPPGLPLAALKKGVLLSLAGSERRDTSGRAIPILSQIRQLIALIEWVTPVRIVSIHGKHEKIRPEQGIFVDPRYEISSQCVRDDFVLEHCKFDTAKDPAYSTQKDVAKQFDSSLTKDGRDDDALAKRLADAVAQKDPVLVAGNRLGDPAPRVHYLEKLADKDKPENERGYSLGDWGPVDVVDGRQGAPVFTIETYQNHESWAFDGKSGEQRVKENGEPLKDLRGRAYPMPPGFVPPGGKDRAKQLHDLAQAIIDVILNS
jgi:hypothetical protein